VSSSAPSHPLQHVSPQKIRVVAVAHVR
jgi:hypothetical protein